MTVCEKDFALQQDVGVDGLTPGTRILLLAIRDRIEIHEYIFVFPEHANVFIVYPSSAGVFLVAISRFIAFSEQ